ncbi:hypothetical protein Tco_1118726 [Tanacetum coccineum]
MSTNRRQRKRQLKIPIRYADHVMGNMSQKQKDVNKAVKSKDTMVEKGDLNEVIGENEISKDGGVFGCKPNEEPNEELIIGSQNVYGSIDRQENEELNKEPNKQDNKKVGVKTYANVTECDKQLNTIPTEIDSNGNEVVVFDEVLVAKGSKRWEMTVVEEGFMEVKNRKIGSAGEKVIRQNFRLNTQPPRTGNNKQVKSKEKQVTQFAYQPKKKDVNEGK